MICPIKTNPNYKAISDEYGDDIAFNVWYNKNKVFLQTKEYDYITYPTLKEVSKYYDSNTKIDITELPIKEFDKTFAKYNLVPSKSVNLSSVLRQVRDNETDIARKKILDVLFRKMNFNDTKVEFKKKTDDEDIGVFVPMEDKLRLYKNNLILGYYNTTIDSYGADSINFDDYLRYIILHEAVHAFVSYQIALDDVLKLSDEEKEIISNLKTLYKYVKEKATKDDLNNYYGLKDIQEFVAEAFSNNSFALYLAGIESPLKDSNVIESALQSFVRMVKKLLGIEIRTVLEDTYDNIEKLIDKIEFNYYEALGLNVLDTVNMKSKGKQLDKKSIMIILKASGKYQNVNNLSSIVDNYIRDKNDNMTRFDEKDFNIYLKYSSSFGKEKQLPEITTSRKSLDSGLEWLRNILPNANVEFEEGIINGKGSASYNSLLDLMTFSRTFADKGSVKHEYLHRQFDKELYDSAEHYLLDKMLKSNEIQFTDCN